MRTIKSAAFVIALVTFSVSAKAAFIGVLPATPGGTDWQAYYDDQLGITWAADAGVRSPDSWENPMAWAASLTIDGVTGWRLPSMDVNNNDVIADCTTATQVDCKDNEYGHLFYYGSGTVFEAGVTSTNPNPFDNIMAGVYWSGTEYAVNTAGALGFNLRDGGLESVSGKGSSRYAWAVHDGNVGVVPVPAAVWLFGSALGLLAWIRRKAT
jgi:hypothetical protein